MKDSERFKLLYGPYSAPRVQRGDELEDVARGEVVKVGGWTDAPIPWPRILKTGKPALIVTDELARAVRTESEIAISHHWGVGVVTVWGWRKKLGVGRINAGTSRLHKEYYETKLPEWIAAKGREKAADPEIYRRMSEARTGKPAHPNTAKALQKFASRRKLKGHREAIGTAGLLHWLKLMPPISRELVRAVVEYRKLSPRPSRGVKWAACEEAMLGLGPDRVIAQILGRSQASVSLHRGKLGIASFKDGRLAIGLPNKLATTDMLGNFTTEELNEIFDINLIDSPT